jgi:DNA-binding transcriptional MocR family regulator
VSHVLQRLAADLLTDRVARKQVEHAARAYRSRREALLEALRRFGIEARGASGYNVWVPVAEETPIVQALAVRGWAVAAGERFRVQSPPAIRITAATLEPPEARRLATDMAAIVAGGRALSA